MKLKKLALLSALTIALSTNAYAYTSVDVNLATQNYLKNVNGQYKSEQPATQSQQASQNSSSGNAIKLTLDGAEIKTDVAPVIIDGRTLVPVRAIFEALGATVGWDEATRTVTANKSDITIKLVLDNKIATVNGQSQTLDVPAQSIDGRTMVPARFVADNLNYNVNWDNATKTVALTTYNNAYDHLDVASQGVAGVPDGWFPCDFGTLEAAAKAVLDGYAVYVNGQYWCSPDYANLVGNENVVWSEDIAKDKPSQPVYNVLGPNTKVEPVPNQGGTSEAERQALADAMREMIASGSATATVK